jgi:AbrB family looped-hinge helix DNA binding protein
MTHKVGAKGQVVIPKEIRDRIGIRPGDEVTFDADGGEVRVRRVEDHRTIQANRIKALRGIWTDGGGTDALIEERRREREREERKAEDRGVGRL